MHFSIYSLLLVGSIGLTMPPIKFIAKKAYIDSGTEGVHITTISPFFIP